MEAQPLDATSAFPQVRVTLRLGSESYSITEKKGSLSEQLVSVKEESMTILKDFITKHNVPNDVPDEVDEGLSEDDDDAEIADQSQLKTKKTKII